MKFEGGKRYGDRYWAAPSSVPILGAGASACVYAGWDDNLEREIAIKVLREHHAKSNHSVERFINEARAVAKLDHPNVVRVYDVGNADGEYYIAMEYVRGESLAKMLRNNEPLPEPVALRYAIQIASALAEAHRQRILHRDIKPSNILVSDRDIAKLTDFGIARFTDPDRAEYFSITPTLLYMSPEQVQRKRADARADLYQLGLVLYEMLTGKFPFPDAGVLVPYAHLNTPAPPVNAENANVSQHTCEIVAKLLQKDPEKRFASSMDLVVALEAADAEIVAQIRTSGTMPPFAHAVVDETPKSHDPISQEPVGSSAPELTQVANEPAPPSEPDQVAPTTADGFSVESWMLAPTEHGVADSTGPFADRITEHTGENSSRLLLKAGRGQSPHESRATDASVRDNLSDARLGAEGSGGPGPTRARSVHEHPRTASFGARTPDTQRKRWFLPFSGRFIILGAVALLIAGTLFESLRAPGFNDQVPPAPRSSEDRGAATLPNRPPPLPTTVSSSRPRDQSSSAPIQGVGPQATAVPIPTTALRRAGDHGGSLEPSSNPMRRPIMVATPSMRGSVATIKAPEQKPSPIGAKRPGQHEIAVHSGRDQGTSNRGSRSAATTDTQRGISYYTNGQYDLAISTLTAALHANPTDTLALLNRAFSYDKRSLSDSAIADYDTLLRIDPTNATGFNGRGFSYDAKGQYGLAIADYTSALRIDPNQPFWYNNRGISYNKKGEADLAIADFTAALRLYPNFAWAHNNRGHSYNMKGQYDQAIVDLSAALRLDPKNVTALNNRGSAYGSIRKYDLAIADFTAGLRIDPNNAPAYNFRGITYRRMGENNFAIADFTAALKINPNYAPAYVNRGLAYRSLEQNDLAMADFEAAKRHDPNSGGAHNGSGLVKFDEGNFADAVREFNRAVASAPSNSFFVLWLHLASMRSAISDAAQFASNTNAIDHAKWPALIIDMYLGKVTPAQVLSGASNDEERCGAYFYIGEWNLLHHSAAAAEFQQAVLICEKRFVEYQSSRVELRRLPR